VALLGLGIAFWGAGWRAQSETGDAALRHVAAIKLPGVVGRIDHLAADVDHDRLIVAATGNRTVGSSICAPARGCTACRA
jgi:hypothetical protein